MPVTDTFIAQRVLYVGPTCGTGSHVREEIQTDEAVAMWSQFLFTGFQYEANSTVLDATDRLRRLCRDRGTLHVKQ